MGATIEDQLLSEYIAKTTAFPSCRLVETAGLAI